MKIFIVIDRSLIDYSEANAKVFKTLEDARDYAIKTVKEYEEYLKAEHFRENLMTWYINNENDEWAEVRIEEQEL